MPPRRSSRTGWGPSPLAARGHAEPGRQGQAGTLPQERPAGWTIGHGAPQVESGIRAAVRGRPRRGEVGHRSRGSRPAFCKASRIFGTLSGGRSETGRAAGADRHPEHPQGRLQAGGRRAQRQGQPQRTQPVLGRLRSREVAGPEAIIDLHHQRRGDVPGGRDRPLRAGHQAVEDQRIAADHHAEPIRHHPDILGRVLEVAAAVLDAHDVGDLREPGQRLDVDLHAAAGGRVVVEQDRQARALGDAAVVVEDLLLGRQDEIRRDDRHAVGPLVLGHLRQADDLAGRLGPGAGEDGHPLVDVGHRRGDHLLLLGLVQGAELAVGAEDEDAVDPAGDQVIDEPAQTRDVQVLVVLHRGRDGRDDPLNLHEHASDTSSERIASRRSRSKWTRLACSSGRPAIAGGVLDREHPTIPSGDGQDRAHRRRRRCPSKSPAGAGVSLIQSMPTRKLVLFSFFPVIVIVRVCGPASRVPVPSSRSPVWITRGAGS